VGPYRQPRPRSAGPVALLLGVVLITADLRGLVDLRATPRGLARFGGAVAVGVLDGPAAVLASTFGDPPKPHRKRKPKAAIARPTAPAAAGKAVRFALAQRGKPFRWAATGPDAYDCSGLMWAAWQAAGVSIPRTAQSQLDGLPRARGGLRPGDLLVYRSVRSPSGRHVAMVVNGRQMVEAPRRGVGVRLARLRRGELGAVRPTAAASGSAAGAHAPSGAARSGIPARYLRLYREVGAGSGVAWHDLAAIGKVETNHGRAPLPGVRSGVNTYGCCAGPMQFNVRNGPPSTWDTWGQGGNVYDPRDAIGAAARYLKASGYGDPVARPGYRRCPGIRAAPGTVNALRHYNNACWYVAQVLAAY